MAAEAQTTGSIRFLLNGRPVEAAGSSPQRSLLDFLRRDGNCTGVKEGCAEGDCGACTVVIGELREDRLYCATVNACILLLPMVDGKSVFSVEYLSTDGDLHPVQQAMIECHGSQCGFCTPGFVMSLWQMYNDWHGRAGHPGHQQLLESLSGNLCRCTGYKPILEAGRRMFELDPRVLDVSAIESGLRDLQRRDSLHYEHQGQSFLAPRDLDELLSIRRARPSATLLAGCTDVGLWVNKRFKQLGDILYLGAVEELRRVDSGEGRLRIGAGVSLNQAYRAVARYFPELEELRRRFGGEPVRNAGTLGGNLANASPIGDSMPWLMVLGARVVLLGPEGERRLPLEDFYLDYLRTALGADEVLAAVELPLSDSALCFRVYKVGKRFDSDISAVCGAFALRLEGARIISARVAFGGMAATPRRAPACESTLVGADWNEACVRAAMDELSRDYAPLDDLRASAAYRARVAANLLYRFYLETRPVDPLPSQQTRVFAERGAGP